MSALTHFVRERFEKNLPGLRCALGGGLYRFVLSPHPRPLENAVPVFCYHVVTRAALWQDLQFLRDNGYTTITADALLNHMTGRQQAPPSAVVLSFDDGSANLYYVAFPLLRTFDMTAVAFICPGLHEEDPTSLTPAYAHNNWSSDLCTWAQLREMHESGIVDIQSHTLEHRHLRRWPTPVPLSGCSQQVYDQRRRAEALPLNEDLRLAKDILQQRLDKEVRHLAWPRMLGTPEALEAGCACGYEAFWGCVTPRRSVNRLGDPPHRITRLSSDLIHRLPGKGRCSLWSIISSRLGQHRGSNGGRAHTTIGERST